MGTFKPFNHLGFLINRVGRLMSNNLRDSIQDEGHEFPNSCVGILADLWLEDGVTQKELAISLIKNKSTISTMLETLQEDDYVFKQVNPQDKRNKKIFLTEKAKQLQSQVEKSSHDTEQTLLKELSREEIETCKKVLRTLYYNLSKQDINQLQNE